jgi:hypothetical protein
MERTATTTHNQGSTYQTLHHGVGGVALKVGVVEGVSGQGERDAASVKSNTDDTHVSTTCLVEDRGVMVQLMTNVRICAPALDAVE